MLRLIFLMVTMLSIYGQAEPAGSVPSKQWAWKPLFNHGVSGGDRAPFATEAKNNRTLFLDQLASFLEIKESKVEGEFVNQEENDQLLRQLVEYQFKATDLLALIAHYSSGDHDKIKTICLQSVERCDDGRKVLMAFLDVQNRIEELEAGRMDLRGLPPEQFEAYASSQFLCFYYDIRSAQFREQFKKEHSELLKKMVNEAKDLTTYEDPHLSEAQVTALTEGWEKRMIVARCWRKERVLEWKNNYLQRQMPEVLR